MLQDFDDSLPSHSVFVPADTTGVSKKVTPKPFLRKGSRKEPSAVHRRGASSSPVSYPNTGTTAASGGGGGGSNASTEAGSGGGGMRNSQQSMRRSGISSTPTPVALTSSLSSSRQQPKEVGQHHGAPEAYGRNGHRQLQPAAPHTQPQPHLQSSQHQHQHDRNRHHHFHEEEEEQQMEDSDQGINPLDTSIVSTSTLCFGDTSTIDLHQRWAQERQQSQLELDEFKKIEQELDGMAVNPLLMTSTENMLGEAFPRGGRGAGAGAGGVRTSKDSRDSRDSGRGSGVPRRQSRPDDHNYVQHHPHDREMGEGGEEEEEEEEASGGPGEKSNSSWVHQPASYFMGDSSSSSSRSATASTSGPLQQQGGGEEGGELEWTRLQPGQGGERGGSTFGTSQQYPYMDTGGGAYSTYASTRGTADFLHSGGDSDRHAGRERDVSGEVYRSDPDPGTLTTDAADSRGGRSHAYEDKVSGDDDDDDDDDDLYDYDDEDFEAPHQQHHLSHSQSRTASRPGSNALPPAYQEDDEEGGEFRGDGGNINGYSGYSGGGGEVRRSAEYSADDSRSWGEQQVEEGARASRPHRDIEGGRDREGGLRYSSGRGVAGAAGNGAMGGPLGGSDQQRPPATRQSQSRSQGRSVRSSQSQSLSSSFSAGNRGAGATSAAAAAGGGGGGGGGVRESITPSSSSKRAIRPLSGGKTRRSATTRDRDRDRDRDREGGAEDVGPRLAQKAKELEQEIETYKKENATLKHVRKQQELILAEMEQQRSELKAWIESEKQKASDFCSESKEAAIRERRAAAKYARDTKASADAGNSGPNRKERAEIEALKATIEKIKLDHEEAQKKWKSNAVRLQQTNKENAVVIAALQEQVASLEFQLAKHTQDKTGGGKKKKKVRDYGYTSTSYAQEEELNGSGDTGVLIEQYSSKTGLSVFTSTATARVQDENDQGEGEGGYARSSRGGGGRGGGHCEDTLDYSSGVMEYGTLNEYDDFSDTITRTRTMASPMSNSGPEEQLPPVYDPSKYEHEYEHAGGGQGLAGSMTSIATAATSTSHSHDRSSSMQRQRNTSSISSSSSSGGGGGGGGGASSSSRNSPKRVTATTPDGVKVTKYSNGTVKRLHPDGQVEVAFQNGDSKKTLSTGAIVYYYANAQTTHTTFVDGSEVYEFPNNQVEMHFVDGRKEITFPNKTKKTIYPDQYEESVFPDGVVVREFPGGRKEVVKP